MIVLSAAACGADAQRILAAGEPGAVIGLTSRGIFCATASGKVVFVSFEAWRGPLTINLVSTGSGEGGDLAQPAFQKGQPPFDRVLHNSVVGFQAGQLSFVEADVRVQTAHLAGWLAQWTKFDLSSVPSPRGKGKHREMKVLAQDTNEPPPFRFREGGRVDRSNQVGGITPQIHSRYRKVAGEVARLSEGKGWNGLLQRWTVQPGIDFAGDELEQVNMYLEQLAAAFRLGDLDGAITSAARLLGRGSGLTPSGDDVLTGFLLTIGRVIAVGSTLTSHSKNDEETTRFYKSASLRIVEEARQKTTWLASSLIECAAAGQADERLVTALHGVLAGSLPLEECARRLLAYGSSSGADVWVGVGLALHL